METDFPLAPKDQVEAYEKKAAEINAQVAPLRQAIRRLEEPYRQRLAREKYKKYPANVQRAIAIPEDRANPGRGAARRHR